MDIEQQIKEAGADVAPRVTQADIEAAIEHEIYFTAAQGAMGASIGVDGMWRTHTSPPALNLLTFCVLVLRNGFTITGQSACASPENFNVEIGRKIARQDAVRQVWPLLGYALRDKLCAIETAIQPGEEE